MVTVGHNATVHGCTVGNRSLIGMGAILLNGCKIGNDCIVGAGALVTGKMDAPDGSLILGSPAKVVRKLTEEEIKENETNAMTYMCLKNVQ
jgi:carbonic anhydrase/acetyltransferase-like protein (isoleucine patch superfamily)